MANDLNQCNFIGRLGKDPEIRYLADGKAVANLSLACGWKSRDKEGTEWVRVSAFGKLAEIIGEYLKKGSQVFISGRMTTRKWQDQSGADRYTTEVVADQMQMLDSRAGSGDSQRQQAPEPAPDDGFDDDIPF